MRILVFAYHNIGFECLKHLIQIKENVVGVVTHEDDPDEEIWFRSVATLAADHRLPLFTPTNPNAPRFIQQVRELRPELIFSFYYRKILLQDILNVPPLGSLNLHGSFLPKYRGRSPVNWVLVNGETETGVTLHYMVERADAGDIVAQKKVPIDLEDTALTLYDKMTQAALELFRDSYPLLKAGRAPRIPQNSMEASKFGGRKPEDGRIDWQASALTIYNLIRAVTHPYPGAFTQLNGKKVYLWQAQLISSHHGAEDKTPGTVEAIEKGKGIVVSTGSGSLLVTRIQHEGVGEMDSDLAAERHGIQVGTLLGK